MISVYISKINEETRDTIPVESGTIHVCSETGVTKYYVDNTGHVDFKCSSTVWVIYIESSYRATIPFPRTGCRYNVTLPCYGIRNIDADLFKVQGDDLWRCHLYKDSLYFCVQHKNHRLGSQYKKSIEETNKNRSTKRLKERKREDRAN